MLPKLLDQVWGFDRDPRSNVVEVYVGYLRRKLRPDVVETVRFVAEIVAGAVLIFTAGLLWRRRHRMIARGMPASNPQRKSSILLGATITALELPTAFPYFAAIAAIVGSGLGPVREFILLLVFNLCFVATQVFAPDLVNVAVGLTPGFPTVWNRAHGVRVL